jgi:hypothetical protein
VRRTEEEFEDRPSERIYLAISPGEARRVEACLDAVPADYFVRLEPWKRPWLSFGTAIGAAFYVAPEEAAACRARLRESRLAKGILEE